MKKLSLFTALILIVFAFQAPQAWAIDWPDWVNPTKSVKKKGNHQEAFRPYVESTRELQIPQWEAEEWYVEDWTSQKNPIELIRGFYKAEIIHNQRRAEGEVPVLVVGPNFYRLSGLDKRKVMQSVDTIYGITASGENASFFVEDWYTKRFIGAFDKNGLRLN